MLSLAIARKLKKAGLQWTPGLHDFFAVPDRDLDDRVFVISDMFANVAMLRGHLAMTFHGTVEWALDHVLLSELVWLPREGQLRQELERRLSIRQEPGVRFSSAPDGYVCEFRWRDQWLRFEAPDASEAYAAALLHVLAADQ